MLFLTDRIKLAACLLTLSLLPHFHVKFSFIYLHVEVHSQALLVTTSFHWELSRCNPQKTETQLDGCSDSSLVRLLFSMSFSRAATRGAAEFKVKFWNRDSFLSASRASLPISLLMGLSIFRQQVLSLNNRPNLSRCDLLVALLTGFGTQKQVCRNAFVDVSCSSF